MYRDGVYAYYSIAGKEHKELGRFRIEGDSIKYEDDKSEGRLEDQFPEGEMSDSTKSRVNRLLSSHHGYAYLQIVAV